MVFEVPPVPLGAVLGSAGLEWDQRRFDAPVFLPGNTRVKVTSGRLFVAKVEGESQADPFGCPILQALIDSHFVVHEWLIRRQATYAKSKTFRRMNGQECLSYKS